MAAAASPIMMPTVGTASTSSMSNISQPAPASQLTTNQHFQPYYLRPAYRFKAVNTVVEAVVTDGPGRRLRKNVANVRRHVDYIANVLWHSQGRLWQYNARDRPAVQPDILYQNCCLPPSSIKEKPVDCVLTKFVRAAMNKVKCPIYSVCWTPEGKRLITGASTGEFTLWNGTAFNFETILQAHDTAIRAMQWSHNDQWLVSADHDGFVKYWQPNMNNVHMFQAHKDEPIRSLSFSPCDAKIVTASDDATARIWDFARYAEERVLRGHGSDIRCVDWHPHKALICTGSRDSQQPVKLWDPKTGQCLSTLHDHKNSVMDVEWNKNGNWLLTGSRDHLIKMYDIRMMREVRSYRGHKKEVTSLAWHPVHESLFVSGGGDGSLAYWLVNTEKELGFLEHAHDQAVWTLQWHPLGHILASGSNDNNTKFWARNRPGDTQDDIFGMTSFTGAPIHLVSKDAKIDADEEALTAPVIPGMGLDDDVFQGMQNCDTNTLIGGSKFGSASFGGPLLVPEDPNARQQSANIGAKRTLIKQPPPKKAQRQFERMWNVAKPAGGGEEFTEEIVDEGSFKRPKTSLLGPPPSLAVSNESDADNSSSPQIPGTSSQMRGDSSVDEYGRQLGFNQAQQSQDFKNPEFSVLTPYSVAGNLNTAVPPNAFSDPLQQQKINQGLGKKPVIQQSNENMPTADTSKQGSSGRLTHVARVAPMQIQGIPHINFSHPGLNQSLLWPASSASSSAQNADIDYRMNTLSTSQAPLTTTQSASAAAGDIDLRHEQSTTALQSWRPAATTSDLSSSNQEMNSRQMEDVKRVHDPRMRRGRGNFRGISEYEDRDIGRQIDDDVGLRQFQQKMRDPRRRPPTQGIIHQEEMDYDRFEGGPPPPPPPPPPQFRRPWGRDFNDPPPEFLPGYDHDRGRPHGFGNHGETYEEYEERQSRFGFHPYGGSPMRRGGGFERSRGWTRGRRGF